MQVTLTPHAAELLRQAMALNPGQAPEQIIEQALAVRLASASEDAVWQQLNDLPGIQLPAHWPPRFAKFEPIPITGEPLSEQLIRERR